MLRSRCEAKASANGARSEMQIVQVSICRSVSENDWLQLGLLNGRGWRKLLFYSDGVQRARAPLFSYSVAQALVSDASEEVKYYANSITARGTRQHTQSPRVSGDVTHSCSPRSRLEKQAFQLPTLFLSVLRLGINCFPVHSAFQLG